MFKEGTNLEELIRPHCEHPAWGAHANKLLNEVGYLALVLDCDCHGNLGVISFRNV